MLVVDCDGTAVTLVAWPDEHAIADDLARAGRPRVLLVSATAAPPDVDDVLEDWVRVPADHRDVEVRAARLARIASERPRRSLMDRDRCVS